jgi:intracellular septation protein
MSGASEERELGAGMRLALDVGPLILFFVANWKLGIYMATGIFIVAILAAMMVSLALTRKVTALQLFSGVMVVVMGGLTIWLHDETFIKLKPTIYYTFVAGILGFGLATGRPVLKSVLGSAYPGLEEAGWTKLTRNWAVFFAVMAVANELVWRNSSTDFWIGYKLWGAIPVTLLFAVANVPMLMRHGLARDEAAAVSEPAPIE